MVKVIGQSPSPSPKDARGIVISIRLEYALRSHRKSSGDFLPALRRRSRSGKSPTHMGAMQLLARLDYLYRRKRGIVTPRLACYEDL